MARRGKGKKSDAGLPSGGSAAPRPPSERRDNLELFVLGPRHVELIEGLLRARPELAAHFDLRLVEPGCESIETLSMRAHRWLLDHEFDLPVFKLLCGLNGERMHAKIVALLDEQGLPCSEDDVLAALFAQLQRYYCFRGPSLAQRHFIVHADVFDAVGDETTFFSGLAAVARTIVAEQTSLLAAGSTPTEIVADDPTDPAIQPTTSAALIVDAARHVDRRGWRLPLGQLRRWIAHALFRLPADERRLLHLRTHRELPIAEIARRLGLAAFEAGIRLHRALDHLLDEIDRLLDQHESHSAMRGHAATPRAGGRLVQFPGTRGGRATVEPKTTERLDATRRGAAGDEATDDGVTGVESPEGERDE